MRSTLIELSAITQPFNRIAHWVASRAGNDASVSQPQALELADLKLLVRPRLGKVRKLATVASNSDRIGPLPPATSLQLASHNRQPGKAAGADTPSPRIALRVVVKPDNAGSGRMVISGRMADVCAELDRLDRLQMQPCA